MADFSYVVINKQGKEKKGSLEANSLEEATSKLKSEGNIVISVNKATLLTKDIEFSFGGRVKTRDLSIFCRQFISMVRSGVTILDALDMLAAQTENKTMAKAIRGVHAEIQKGENLSDAMGKFPKVFPKIMVDMVAAGEASGKLEIAFERMAKHFEKTTKINGMIRKAAVYPIIVAVVALVVVIVMLVKVIPSYQDMFDELGADLPAITKAVVVASDFIIHRWYVMIAVIVILVVAIRVFKKTERGQRFFGALARKIPVFGKLNIKTACSNFARTLSTLIASGLPLIDAIVITANTMTNFLYKEALLEAKDSVAKGIPLSEPLEDCGLFPPMVYHMTRIGEETGELEEMLSRMADYYDEEVEMATQTVMAALEPMIILLLAAIVGVLVAAIMSPMIAMYSALDSL